jgi:hypothetical protein
MTSEALFTAALQVEQGGKVTERRFEAEPRWLLLKLDLRGNALDVQSAASCARP